MPDNTKAVNRNHHKLAKVPAEKPSRTKRHTEQSNDTSLDIRRLFMPNVDKIVKNVMHEISDGKAALREIMKSALHNQEIIINQNKNIISLLEELARQQKSDHAREEIVVDSTPISSVESAECTDKEKA